VESFPSLVVVSYQWGPTEPTETLATHGLGGPCYGFVIPMGLYGAD
jgi:hypothetical protein